MPSLAQRVAASLKRLEKDRAAAAYKAGEPERRRSAARAAAEVRQERRVDALLAGRLDPRSRRDFQILDRAEFGE